MPAQADSQRRTWVRLGPKSGLLPCAQPHRLSLLSHRLADAAPIEIARIILGSHGQLNKTSWNQRVMPHACYTTKSHGVGMGLSICRSVIDAHGGRLWADANVPRGAVFQFTLPSPERSSGILFTRLIRRESRNVGGSAPGRREDTQFTLRENQYRDGAFASVASALRFTPPRVDGLGQRSRSRGARPRQAAGPLGR
jgi:hypothetical protein